jgi:hypothetical protein
MNDPMKKIPYLIISILFSSGLYAQGVYNNGAKIVIGTGATLNISGTGGNYRNETNVSNGSVDLSGTMKIAGNLTNNVIASDVFSSMALGSVVAFSGTTSQTVGGTTTATNSFTNLTINNSSGIVLAKNALVNGTMTFTSGLVDIVNNNFTFGPLSTIAGTPSSASMIIATGTGQVMRNWLANGAFTFPVGDNNLTAKYSPVSLNFTAATFAANAYAGINLVNAKFNDPSIAGSYLNRYWNVSQSGITAFACDAMFQYLPGDVMGTESSINSLRMMPAPFTAFSPTNITLQQLSATGLTSFGTFTGGMGSKTLNLKLFFEGLYVTGGTMNQSQGLVGNQFPGITADQLTVELHDPITYATLITSVANSNLSTSGFVTAIIPVAFGGSYYIAIKHRNSIATVTSAPVLFSAPTINYDFTTAGTQAFGNNLKNMAAGVNVIFGGDVNQDGIIDLGDILPIGNQAAFAGTGYLPEDINGDGLVDLSDITIISNNSAQAVGTITP